MAGSEQSQMVSLSPTVRLSSRSHILSLQNLDIYLEPSRDVSSDSLSKRLKRTAKVS